MGFAVTLHNIHIGQQFMRLQKTPFFFMYKRDPLLPSDLFMNKWIEGHKKLEDYTIEIVKRFKATKQRVREDPETKTAWKINMIKKWRERFWKSVL